MKEKYQFGYWLIYPKVKIDDSEDLSNKTRLLCLEHLQECQIFTLMFEKCEDHRNDFSASLQSSWLSAVTQKEKDWFGYLKAM